MTARLHWRAEGRDYHLYRNGRRIAALLFNVLDTMRSGRFLWISDVIHGPSGGWHAVDFLSVEDGRSALEEWAASVAFNDNEARS